MLVNPHEFKAVPGRKTDAGDAEWLCDLLRHGLLRPSFVPERAQRELRELVRYRRKMIEERVREYNRLEKVLEGAGIEALLRGEHDHGQERAGDALGSR